MSVGETILSRLVGTLKATFGIGPKTTRGTLSASGLTAARTFSLPDATGTLALTSMVPAGSGTSTGTNTGDQTITLTGDVTGSGTGSFAATIGANKVTDAILRDSIPLSVVGRGVNSTGDPGDIQCGTDGHVLKRVGNTLVFAYAGVDSGADDAAPYDIIVAGTASGVYGTIPGWTFTAPATGVYVVIVTASAVTAATGAGNYISIGLWNGATYQGGLPDVYCTPASEILNAGTTGVFYVAATAGDVFVVKAAQIWTGAQTHGVVYPRLLQLIRVA